MSRAALALAAAAALSAAVGLRFTAPDLDGLHGRFAGYDASAAEHAPAIHERLRRDVWDFFRAEVGENDRFFLDAPAGGSRGFVDERTVLRTFAAYWLLPAVQTLDRADATVVLTHGVPAPRGRCLRPGYCVVHP